MTGFEVAGIVLGVLPLLVSAMEHYAEGVKTLKRMAKYKAHAEDLIVQLIVVHSSFRNTCEKLLVRLQLPDEDLIFLLQPQNQRAWKTASFNDRINKYLKNDYESCKWLLLQIFGALDEFRVKLGLPEDYLILSDYTPSWFKTDSKRSIKEHVVSKLTKAGKAVQLGFEDGEYNSMVQRMDRSITALEKILKDWEELEPIRIQRSRRRNARLWTSIRQFATSLYSSIRWGCSCPTEHTANLRLQIRQRDANKGEESEDCKNFNLLFSSSRDISVRHGSAWLWRWAQIEPSEILEQAMSRVSFATAGQSSVTTTGAIIPSLCQALQDAPQTTQCIGYLETQNHRYHIFTSKEDQQRKVLSLGEILRQKNTRRVSREIRPCDYSDKERYQLSLLLAYNVLQLYNTPWLRDMWGKNDIYFISNGTNLVENLYVSRMQRQIGLSSPYGTSPEIRPWSNPTIYALGITLLELAFGCSLEAIPAAFEDMGPNGTPDQLTDCRKAGRLATSIEKRDGPLLATAISRCLRYEAIDSKDPMFQEAFYDNVVAHLEKCVDIVSRS